MTPEPSTVSVPWRSTAPPRVWSTRALPRRILRRLLRTGIRWGRVTFFRRDTASELASERVDGDFHVEEAGAGQLPWLLSGANPSQTAEHLLDRFARGDRCFVAVDAAGQPAHVRWVTTTLGYIPEIEQDLVLRPGEAYFYDGYTRPEARGKGVDGLVRRSIFQTLRAQGVTRVWSYVRSDNPAGLRAAARWQSREGTVSYIGPRGLRPLCWGGPSEALPALVPHRGERADRTG